MYTTGVEDECVNRWHNVKGCFYYPSTYYDWRTTCNPDGDAKGDKDWRFSDQYDDTKWHYKQSSWCWKTWTAR